MRKHHFLKLICSCGTFLFMIWTCYIKLWHFKWTDDYHGPLADATSEVNFDSSVERIQLCTRLREKYASLTALKLHDSKEFTVDMKEILSCPWKENITQKVRYRVELYSSCNATKTLILTKQNTVLGQNITYDAEWRRTRVVDNSLLEMLPETTPWRTGGLGRCAVIGNGGILKNSSCGSKINGADFVIRLNLAPISFSADVGVKTNLMTANPTQIQRSYPNLKKQPKPLADKMSSYGNPPLILPAFAFSFCTRICFQVHQALKSVLPQQKVVFFNPKYLRELHHYWRQRGQRAPRLSTGLMLASIALELCDEVHLYGFWPFNFDLFQNELSHHYYDNVLPHGGFHSMPREFLQLLKMHMNGAIKLHIGKCQ